MTLSVGSHRALCVRTIVGLLVLLAAAPLTALAADYAGGDGTKTNPYLISTVQEFATIGQTSADWSKHFKLVGNLDLSDCNETNLQMIGKWVVLGSASNQPFSGSFDGDGYTISGFHYKDMQSQYVGLFQYVTGDIRNLTIAGATVVGDGVGTGALVGYLNGGLNRCSATAVKISGNQGVGALAGVVDGGVHYCRSNGSVFGVRFVGGLIGQLAEGTVTRSYSRATVVGSDSVGGFAGTTTKQAGAIDSCYATGSVNGVIYVGGLVGDLGPGTVWRSYSTGVVTGTQSVGGLVGYQRALAAVYVSFWDTETSHQATSVGGYGKTTAEMKSFSTYSDVNWDFAATWAICEGVGYPVFLWQLPVGDLRCPDGVNFTDFVWFANYWHHDDCGALNYSCMGADLDGSGKVDASDLALFAANWMAGVD